MTKILAILNVLAWAGFWAFGFLALSAEIEKPGQMNTAFVLAAFGGAVGLWAWFKLVRNSEATGYAKLPNRADRSHLEIEGGSDVLS